MRLVWFHRGYRRVTGGQVKVSHYFGHVLRMPGFAPMIAFAGEPLSASYARTLRELWPAGRDPAIVGHWEPGRHDLFFLAGVDWRYPEKRGFGTPDNPRINLIQGLRHVREGTELYGYLAERAVRICVSHEVAEALRATGRAKGPVLAIPNGIDVEPFEPDGEGAPAGYGHRTRPIVIAGYKRPELARDLSERLHAAHIEHRLLGAFVERSAFLDALAESQVAVCLPYAEEGFYMPALEAMALGCVVVTLDGIGNRAFCRHRENCLVAEPDSESLFRAARRALALSAPERGRLHRSARDTAALHSLEAERRRFHAILGDIDHLWREG